MTSSPLTSLLQGSDGSPVKYDEQCETILNATDRLCNSMGNASVMVKQARLLGQVSGHLVIIDCPDQFMWLDYFWTGQFVKD